MAKKATADDARLILELYDLRREPEMRKARQWWLGTFWPTQVDDFMKIQAAAGTPENNWYRQVAGYWNMVATLALKGAVNKDLFFDNSVCGEMYFLFREGSAVSEGIAGKNEQSCDVREYRESDHGVEGGEGAVCNHGEARGCDEGGKVSDPGFKPL